MSPISVMTYCHPAIDRRGPSPKIGAPSSIRVAGVVLRSPDALRSEPILRGLVADQLPELAALSDLGVDVVLDGELVAGAGRPADFYAQLGAPTSLRSRGGGDLAVASGNVCLVGV